MKLRIAGTVSESIVDGPGLRYVVFTQGCPHNCEGCQNPETHDFLGGKVVDTDDLYNECTVDGLHDGATFSGGEPFCQAEPLYELGKRLKSQGLDIMCYSGWTFEELLKKAETEEFVGKLLSITDILVDGKFVLERRSLSLKFRGSENQRIIDVQKSLKSGNIVEACV